MLMAHLAELRSDIGKSLRLFLEIMYDVSINVEHDRQQLENTRCGIRDIGTTIWNTEEHATLDRKVVSSGRRFGFLQAVYQSFVGKSNNGL